MRDALVFNTRVARNSLARSAAMLGAVLLSCITQVANAVPSPAGIAGNVLFNYVPPMPISVGTFGTHQLSGEVGDVLLDSGLGPSPYLLAQGSMDPFFFGRSAAILRYDVEVVGNDGLIPVHATASAHVQGATVATDDSFATFAARALWWIEDGSGAQIFGDGFDTGSMQGTIDNSFERTGSFSLTANRAYRVYLLADIGVRGASALAYIDPIFSFAEGFGSSYSFIFSEGVGNGSAGPGPGPGPDPTPVSEPGMLALLLAGLVMVGVSRKFSRRTRLLSVERR